MYRLLFGSHFNPLIGRRTKNKKAESPPARGELVEPPKAGEFLP
jgi:hypothetical protein